MTDAPKPQLPNRLNIRPLEELPDAMQRFYGHLIAKWRLSEKTERELRQQWDDAFGG